MYPSLGPGVGSQRAGVLPASLVRGADARSWSLTGWPRQAYDVRSALLAQQWSVSDAQVTRPCGWDDDGLVAWSECSS